jgi:hypothetical protein
VRECTLEEFASREGVEPVDCLAIWNTFDQLADPRPTLDLTRRFVRPGGILALRVPHGRCFRMLLERLGVTTGPARRLFEACLAWNNLCGFPYLHGYGLDSLDLLVTPFGFERAAAEGDVLCLLAGRATTRWARREERAVKQLQRLWIRAQSRRQASALSAAPWLDVYYRRRA